MSKSPCSQQAKREATQQRRKLLSVVGILPKFATKKPRTKTTKVGNRCIVRSIQGFNATSTIHPTNSKDDVVEKASQKSPSSSPRTEMPLCDPGPIPDLNSLRNLSFEECVSIEELFDGIPDC
ncbi:hypothetical protein Ancab_030987 [Ancistrocladus abbreviatus]